MEDLRDIARSIREPDDYFDRSFDAPMAHLRGSYNPGRTKWATSRDFGIVTHTAIMGV